MTKPITAEQQVLPDAYLTQEQMIARGAYGYLTHAQERYIPVAKITVLVSEPACVEWGNYGGDTKTARAIEAKYSFEEDSYLVFNGAQLVKDAERNGIDFVRAFVEPDRGSMGDAARRSLADLHKV